MEDISFNDRFPNHDHLNQQVWYANAVSELIGAVQTNVQVSIKDNTIYKISSLINMVADGDSKAFSRFIGRVDNLASSWLSGKSSIRLDTLLKICFAFDINLTRFLMAKEIDVGLLGITSIVSN